MSKDIDSKYYPHAADIKRVHEGSILRRCRCNKAVYYTVTKVLDECYEPIVARQTKTLVLKFVGEGAKAVENYKQKIYDICDLMPHAQMQYEETEND